jgi:hypothetical protein
MDAVKVSVFGIQVSGRLQAAKGDRLIKKETDERPTSNEGILSF